MIQDPSGPRSHPISGPCAAKALATLPGRSSWPRPGPALLGHRMIPWEPQIASFAAAWKSRFRGSPIETYWNLHFRYLWRTSSTLFNCCEFEIDYLTWRQIEPAIWDFRKDLSVTWPHAGYSNSLLNMALPARSLQEDSHIFTSYCLIVLYLHEFPWSAEWQIHLQLFGNASAERSIL